MSARVIVQLIEDRPKTREQFMADSYYSDEIVDTEYRLYLDRFQPWRWIAKSAGNGEVLARSSESYFNRADCERAIELLFCMSTSVELVRIVDGVEARSPLR